MRNHFVTEDLGAESLTSVDSIIDPGTGQSSIAADSSAPRPWTPWTALFDSFIPKRPR